MREIRQSGDKLDARIDDVRGELGGRIDDVRREMDDVRRDLNGMRDGFGRVQGTVEQIDKRLSERP